MTVLSALQPAMVRLVGRRPNTIFSTQNQTEMELADLATEVATDIMKSHDWRALTQIATLVGDGATTAFDKPADYDRMVQGQDMTDRASWFWNYTPASDLNEWLMLQDGGWAAITPGWWILLDEKFQFYPAPSSDAQYPYISKNFARSAPASGTGVITPKAAFSADDDTFKLDERLLTLGVIWRYREQKGMGYAEDMATYETALSQAQARDRGSRTIRRPERPAYPNAGWAWPWSLG